MTELQSKSGGTPVTGSVLSPQLNRGVDSQRNSCDGINILTRSNKSGARKSESNKFGESLISFLVNQNTVTT